MEHRSRPGGGQSAFHVRGADFHDAAGFDPDPPGFGTREQIFSFGSPLTDQLTLLYHQWVAHTDNHAADPTLFDPVAVTYAVRPELCPAKPLHIEVDDKGMTKPVDGPPNAQVCLHSDETGFFDLLLGRVASARDSRQR